VSEYASRTPFTVAVIEYLPSNGNASAAALQCVAKRRRLHAGSGRPWRPKAKMTSRASLTSIGPAICTISTQAGFGRSIAVLAFVVGSTTHDGPLDRPPADWNND
jgi:hypothetical protein